MSNLQVKSPPLTRSIVRIRIKLATQTLPSAINPQLQSRKNNSSECHSQSSQGEDARKGYFLPSFQPELPHHGQRHAEDDEIERHVRARDGDPVSLEIDALMREDTLHILSLRVRMALEGEAQKRRDEPGDAGNADDLGRSHKVGCVEDAAVEQ